VSDEGERYLVGLSFFMDQDTRSFHRPWATFQRAVGKYRDAIQGRIEPERFCQFSSWLEDDEANGLFILCALEIEGPREGNGNNALAVPPPFAIRHLPASRYLVFTHLGGVALISDSYRAIYGDFLASSEVRPSFSWEVQRYLASGAIEIAIPIAAP
jgi:hypothetical protein